MKVYQLPGLPPFINDDHEKNMTRNNLLRIGQVFFVVIFVLTSQLRIRRYRKSHNLSYFMSYRQNIATIDQTIYYAYVKCFCNFMKCIQFIAVIQFNLILYMDVVGALIGNFSHASLNLRSKIYGLTDCVVIPGWWIISIRENFPELWESKQFLRLIKFSGM